MKSQQEKNKEEWIPFLINMLTYLYPQSTWQHFLHTLKPFMKKTIFSQAACSSATLLFSTPHHTHHHTGDLKQVVLAELLPGWWRPRSPNSHRGWPMTHASPLQHPSDGKNKEKGNGRFLQELSLQNKVSSSDK